MTSKLKKFRVEEEVEMVIKETEKKIEPKQITQKIKNDIEFLSSCTTPRSDELAIVTDFNIKNYAIKYPVVIRERKEPLDIKYLVREFMKSAQEDFKTLKMCASSKIVGQRILENACIKYDNEAKFFLEEHLDSSNSPNSLKMLLGYDLLAPEKVDKVEETNKNDEKNRRIMKVYSLDFRGKYDSLIIGTGIGITKYIGLNCKIEVVH